MTSDNTHKGDSRAGDSPRAIAVALEEQGDAAPTVVASGRGLVAEKILELAFANDVKVREDADLAQILAAVDVDSPIPIDAFSAVAEVLAYLYRVNGDPEPENLGNWPETKDEDLSMAGSP